MGRRLFMSNFLRGLGNFIAFVGGLLGFVLSLIVIYAIAGGGGVLAGLTFFPLVFIFVPFYTLIVHGSWNLLLINYGSTIAGWVLHRMADKMEAEPPAPDISPALVRAQLSKEDTSESVRTWMLVGAGVLILVLAGIFSSPDSASISPTRTPQPAVTKTKTLPPPTRTARPISLHACVTDSTIRIRKGPGTEYEAINGMVSGTCMSILGRNRDSTWVYVVSDDEKEGWVAARLLTIEGDLKQVSVRLVSEALSLAPTAKPIATQKLPATTTNPPSFILFTKTSSPALGAFTSPCSETADQIGEQVSCRIERAYCEYYPSVDGSPTFCNDRPYPNHKFTLVVFDEDWSDYDDECIIVSGFVTLYRGRPQIQAFSRSQVSYCE